jgi:hypothetical protein
MVAVTFIFPPFSAISPSRIIPVSRHGSSI